MTHAIRPSSSPRRASHPPPPPPPRAEEEGYSVCIRVHDELVCETPDEPAYSSDGLAALMATNPSWSVGLPLAAAGFEAYRYRKD